MIEEPLINILIRTSGRPVYFKKCIDSIRKQDYSNYRILISYDTKEDLKYIKSNTNSNDFILFCKISDSTKENFPYNLYINDLYEFVNSGWILVLDDDNMFISNESLTKVAKLLKKENQLVVWKVKLFDKVIPSKSFNKQPTLYDIDSSNFIFHSSYKYKLGQWDGNKCADFRLALKLYKNLDSTIWIDELIIASQRKHIYGGKGMRDDANYSLPFNKKISNKIKMFLWKLKQGMK